MGRLVTRDTKADREQQQRFELFDDGEIDERQADDPHHDHARGHRQDSDMIEEGHG